MADRLKGKVAVVTGAAPRGEGVGNGMACAIMFAREGAKVVLVNRDAGRAEALARQIAQEGGESAVFAGDVTDPAAAEAMANFAVERYGRLDVLHNNVGVGVPGTVATVKLADWHRVLDANLTSAMLCSKFASRRCAGRWRVDHPGVVDPRGDRAVGQPGGSVAYATAKAGLFGLTYSLAADYATENIRANCIVIGSVHTPMVAHMGADARERRRQMVPTQTEGTAWDIAHGAVYLASDEARWVTGIQLPIDGGVTNIRPRPL